MDVPRTLTNALASTQEPPSTQHTIKGDWTWLSSLEEVDRATRIELPVRQEAVPHIVGSKGRTIRALEEKFGVAIWVMDVPDTGALVSFMGHRFKFSGLELQLSCWHGEPEQL